MKSVIPCLLLLPSLAYGQTKDPVIVKPDAETMAKINGKLLTLNDAIREHDNHVDSPDVAVYAKAVEWMIRHGEYFGTKAGEQMLTVLDAGLKRAEWLAKPQGPPPWLAIRGKPIARGYRSTIDGSVQPYLITIPDGFDPRKKDNRLDILLAGRDGTKTEVKWLHRAETAKAGKVERLTIEPYGRGNNAYRWAGEWDVFENHRALDNHNLLHAEDGPSWPYDKARVTLRGFSMGGAGTWHIGLHHPTDFAAIAPGAGFTVTKGYTKLPDTLPDHVEKCLHIYDAADYAENSFNVPVIAYSGEKDGQIAAARNIEQRLAEANAKPIKHFIAPGLEHKQPPEWVKKIDEEIEKHLPRKSPEKIQFLTYTPKFGHADWIDIMAIEKQYERATVKAKLNGNDPVIETTNVRILAVSKPQKMTNDVTLDGVRFPWDESKLLDPQHMAFLKRNNRWEMVSGSEMRERITKRPMKWSRCCGPIDDAFTSRFQALGPTGVPMHQVASLYASASLQRFDREWNKWMRGQLPIAKEPREMGNGHMILFGDPGSNAMIAELLPKLPITWNDKELIVNGVSYDPKTHVPVLISPNPKDPRTYIVLNSGHTFHDADFKGTNALLYPRLGDWAVLKPTPTKDDPAKAEVVAAGLFDEDWQFAKSK